MHQLVIIQFNFRTIIVYHFEIGQQFLTKQEISVSSGLTFGMDKQYLDIVRPSGIIRTWIGVDTNAPRSGVIHELSLKVQYKHYIFYVIIIFLKVFD